MIGCECYMDLCLFGFGDDIVRHELITVSPRASTDNHFRDPCPGTPGANTVRCKERMRPRSQKRLHSTFPYFASSSCLNFELNMVAFSAFVALSTGVSRGQGILFESSVKIRYQAEPIMSPLSWITMPTPSALLLKLRMALVMVLAHVSFCLAKSWNFHPDHGS
jgi:hypothetical protein